MQKCTVPIIQDLHLQQKGIFMREKFTKFMQGRYGVDQFARFSMGVALILIIISAFFRGGNRIGAFFDTLGLLVLLYTYYRMLSRDIGKRSRENQKYLSVTSGIRQRLTREKSMMKQRKDYHIYSCPGCGQKIRIPRNKGKIEIECPKCHTKFIKRS